MAFKARLSKTLGRNATLADEIYLEKRRVELINSSDPAEVQEGKNIETTITILQNSGENLSEYECSGSEVQSLTVISPLMLPDIPPKGNFDVEVLRNSKYFFS